VAHGLPGQLWPTAAKPKPSGLAIYRDALPVLRGIAAVGIVDVAAAVPWKPLASSTSRVGSSCLAPLGVTGGYRAGPTFIEHYPRD